MSHEEVPPPFTFFILVQKTKQHNTTQITLASTLGTKKSGKCESTLIISYFTLKTVKSQIFSKFGTKHYIALSSRAMVAHTTFLVNWKLLRKNVPARQEHLNVNIHYINLNKLKMVFPCTWHFLAYQRSSYHGVCHLKRPGPEWLSSKSSTWIWAALPSEGYTAHLEHSKAKPAI